ncbi:unnamed protein product [Adineta steineri]|uniref:Uncharacterized protein n=1 Tax=Adineta steineri TaxID=433720 RepID=A0A813YF72_9BILA|nr:unnamed protein product [Adineta steineri]
MSINNNAIQVATINNTNYSQDIRNLTHPWGVNPVTHLEQVRQQSRINKLVKIQESLTNLTQSSSNKEEQQENIQEITTISENLKSIRSILLTLNEFDIEVATQYGKEIMMITTNLLSHIVKQIGQTNIQTRTLESIIAYIRSLMHTTSAHMRQTIPGSLLIAWYELSNLMSSLQKEPELKITNKKALQLLDIAHNTAAWAYKHLTTTRSDDEQIGFIDRNSIPYTYE